MSKSKKIQAVSRYYNEWTKHYLETGYGNVIQAHRPPDTELLLQHIAKQSGMANGMRILDAGCGVCGPALYFAHNYEVEIVAITNSQVQLDIAQQNLKQQTLKGEVEVLRGDFHNLNSDFKPESFDLVLMLESFGYAVDKNAVLTGAAQVLKNEGHLYIKDYFAKEITGSVARRKGMKRAIANMNKHYCYQLANLNQTIKQLRSVNLEIVYVMQNPLPIGNQDFVKEFEEQHGIDLFEGGFHYLFLEPLELLFKKPENIDRVLV
ncbi:MAG TPA: class I SAM-dependent methyltransferase [Bacteroidales bacterium]|nr:class I SAM-dependent methyltransferase [Bacteroidales bacterium]